MIHCRPGDGSRLNSQKEPDEKSGIGIPTATGLTFTATQTPKPNASFPSSVSPLATRIFFLPECVASNPLSHVVQRRVAKSSQHVIYPRHPWKSCQHPAHPTWTNTGTTKLRENFRKSQPLKLWEAGGFFILFPQLSPCLSEAHFEFLSLGLFCYSVLQIETNVHLFCRWGWGHGHPAPTYERVFLPFQGLAGGSWLGWRGSAIDAWPSQLVQKPSDVVWPWAREFLQFGGTGVLRSRHALSSAAGGDRVR